MLQSAASAAKLAQVTRVVASPSRRTSSLAEELGRALARPVECDPRLLELSFGEWELRAWDTLAAEDGARLRAWMADWRHAAPPGGERVEQLMARVRSFAESVDGERVLAVTHAGPMRALRAIERGVDYEVVAGEAVPWLVIEAGVHNGGGRSSIGG